MEASRKKTIIQCIIFGVAGILGSFVIHQVLRSWQFCFQLIFITFWLAVCLLGYWLCRIGITAWKAHVEQHKKSFRLFLITEIVLFFIFIVFIALQRGYHSSYAQVKLLLFEIGMIIYAIVYVLLAFYRIKLHQLYAFLGIVMGVIFLFLVPAETVPDEQTHYIATYRISNRMLGIPADLDQTVLMRKDDAERNLRITGYDAELYAEYWASIPAPLGDGTLVDSGVTSIDTFVLQYFMPAVGLSLARLLHMGTISAYLLARFFNLIFWVVMMTFAIRKIPFGKLALFMIALFPMTLQQSASLSYDVFVMGASILLVALSLSLAFDRKQSRRSAMCVIIVLALCTVAVIFVKGGAYFPFTLMPILAFCHNRKENPKLARACLGITAAAFILFGGSQIQSYLWSSATVESGEVIAESEIDIASAVSADTDSEDIRVIEDTGNWIDWDDSPGYTISYFLQHPREITTVAYSTIRSMMGTYIYQAIGMSLGSLEVYIYDWIILIILILTVLSIPKREEEEQYIGNPEKALMAGISVVSILLIFAGMLLAWSPVRYQMVMGVQGRYFIPNIFLGVICFRSNAMTAKKYLDKFIIMGMVVALILTCQSFLA